MVVTAFVLAGLAAGGPRLLEKLSEQAGNPRCGPTSPIVAPPPENRPFPPKIGGDWMVWFTDVEADNPMGFDDDVYAYNLIERRLVAVATGPGVQGVPAVHGPLVVWYEATFDPPSVVLRAMNLTNGTRWTLPIPLESNLTPRGLYRDTLLVEGADEAGNGLFAFNLTTNSLVKVTDCDVGTSEVWRDEVVWVVQNNVGPLGFDQLVVYDLEEKRMHVVLNDTMDLGYTDPDIYEDTIVYMQGNPNGTGWEIRGVKTDSGRRFEIASDTEGVSGNENPRIAGDWVVYWKGDPSGGSTVAKNLRSGRVIEMDDRFGSLSPDVWQDRVAAYWRGGPTREWASVAVVCLGPP